MSTYLNQIEDMIVYISNIDPSHPYIQELLDYEAKLVLQEYYASSEYQAVMAATRHDTGTDFS